MKTISRYIMTLALLITAVGGAWAQSSLNVVEFEVPAGWEGDVTSLTAADFPGFKDYSTLTDDEAKAIPNPDPSYREAIILVYGFDGIETKYIVWDEEDIRVIKMSVARDAFYEETAANRKIYYTYADPNAIEVTTNAASKQDLFTEASFTMPTFDATVNYDIVRDMQDEANPVAFSGLPATGNIVVKKGDGGTYQPAEALTLQLIDPLAAADAQNIIAADGITVKVLVGNGGTPIEYDQENPITLEAFLADMKPGYYWIKAESTDENSPYEGTVYSSEFTVVEKYDLTVKPANDFSKGKIESVTVGSESVTIDANTGEATKTVIAPDTEVKIKAKRGYVIDKVEVKKAGPALKTLTVNGVTIYYAEGDSWANAVSRDENKDSGLFIREGNRVHHSNYGQLVVSNTEPVLPEAIINAKESYRFIK